MKDKMHGGDLYQYNDPALVQEQMMLADRIFDYNHTRPSDLERRQALLRDIFAEVGEGCFVEIPFQANWGCHTHLGNRVYANFNLTLVDDTHIYIGDDTMFGPNVTLATAGHPLDPALRRAAYQQNAPIHIGSNVWIGAHCVVLPGVTIGDNSVIGAGSIVSRDIPADVLALGTPCTVVRALSDHR